MNKTLSLIILCFLLFPSTGAWNWPTHKAIVQKVYYSFPLELTQKLDLELMEEGALAPDKDFHDQRLHHYPPSYNKSVHWLQILRDSLKIKDYENASYAFGVITHYVSDSFVSPHNINGEDPYDHSKFEKQVSTIKTKCKKNKYELNNSLYMASQNNKDWEPWLNSKDPKIPQSELEQTMELVYSIALTEFNTTCNIKTTEIIKQNYRLGSKTQTYLATILILYLILFRKKSKSSKN